MELALTVICVSLILGIVISFLYFVPLTLYSIPYILWLGSQNTKGMYRNISVQESTWNNVKNATKVYLSFITGRKPQL